MSVAVIRILLAIDDVGEFNAALVAFHKVSVTVLRQSTHVPKTSKKRHFGSFIVETLLLHAALAMAATQYYPGVCEV